MKKAALWLSWIGGLATIGTEFLIYIFYRHLHLFFQFFPIVMVALVIVVLVLREIAVSKERYIRTMGVLTLLLASIPGGILTIIYGSNSLYCNRPRTSYKKDAHLNDRDYEVALIAEKTLLERGMITQEQYDESVRNYKARLRPDSERTETSKTYTDPNRPMSFEDWKKRHESE